jgi:hypothetical protein
MTNKMNNRQLHKYIYLTLFVLLSTFTAKPQSAYSTKNFRNNLLKLNLVAVAPLFSGHNEKWIGIEYERFINQKMSFALMSDVGLFEDYTFTKYHDFFDEYGGFAYTRQTTKTIGYHFLPSFRYYYLMTKKKKGQGLYVAGLLDFNQYFRKSEFYHSADKTSDYTSSSTTRLGIGASAGGQYIAWSRLVIDLNVSIFAKVFSTINGQDTSEAEPMNAQWSSSENNGWVVVNFMIGYAFGGGKRK